MTGTKDQEQAAHSTDIDHSHAMEQDLPGTEKLYTLDSESILLLPQPTNNVNDPLTWSPARKYWHGFLVCFVTGFTAATANDAASASEGMNDDLGITYDIANDAAGVLFIGIGYFTLFLAPITTLYGRKIGYLICITLGLIGAIWLGKVQTPGDAIGNQLFVGMSESAAEALVQLSLMDIFFVHQRGTALGIYVLATSIGTYLGPLIGGYIASDQSWRWVGWWSVIISGVTLVVLIFTLEETYFDRDAADQSLIIDGVKPHFDESTAAIGEKPSEPASRWWKPSPKPPRNQVEKKTYMQRMALITFSNNPNKTGYFSRLFHSLRVFSFPAVIYSGLLWGSQDAWLTFYLTTEDDDYYDAPWNYSDKGVALMNVPCLIGAVFGCLFAGPLSDWFVLYMARRNKGVKEAEFRLYFGLVNLIISPLGLLMFGIGTAKGYSWPMPYVGLGFIGFSWGCSGDIAMSYLVDCYPQMVLEGMVGVAVINNTLGMIFTFACETWLTADGTQNTYIAIAVLQFAFVCTTVPMIMYGKRIRVWTKDRYEAFLFLRDGKVSHAIN